MAMFPLGTVLFPYALLPLHVFEPRYRLMMRHVLDGDREFGVVLIERGSEVGGGDTRFDVATVARVVQAAELPDGRYALATVGMRRVRVERWLDDDPYPARRGRRRSTIRRRRPPTRTRATGSSDALAARRRSRASHRPAHRRAAGRSTPIRSGRRTRRPRSRPSVRSTRSSCSLRPTPGAGSPCSRRCSTNAAVELRARLGLDE